MVRERRMNRERGNEEGVRERERKVCERGRECRRGNKTKMDGSDKESCMPHTKANLCLSYQYF